jgi:esterase
MAQFPAAQAKTLEGCGHWLHAQKPVIFNRIVSEFIDKHSMKISSKLDRKHMAAAILL